MNVAGNAMAAIATQKYTLTAIAAYFLKFRNLPLVCSAIVAVAERITKAWVSLASD